jgi:hypothetical protein
MTPAAAGAAALNKDIAVVDIPFAAPLCSCGYTLHSIGISDLCDDYFLSGYQRRQGIELR